MKNGTGFQGLLNVMIGGYYSGPTKPAREGAEQAPGYLERNMQKHSTIFVTFKSRLWHLISK